MYCWSCRSFSLTFEIRHNRSGAPDSIPTNFSVASLLIELCKLGFLPNEKRQCTPGHSLLMLRINSPCLRWCSGRWCQQWQGGNVLFPIAKMSEDSINDFLILYASNDPDRPATATADLDIDGKTRFRRCYHAPGPRSSPRDAQQVKLLPCWGGASHHCLALPA